MLSILWVITLCIAIFSFLPICNVKMARYYGRIFGTAIYAKLWYNIFYISIGASVILMFINLLMGE